MDLMSFFKKKTNSKDSAKSRLQILLVEDRIKCSPQVLEMLRADILKVISTYLEIDEEELEFEIGSHDANSKGAPVLCANIPIKSVKKTNL